MAIRAGYKQTEVGVIPEDWEVHTLDKLSRLMTNGFVGKATTHYVETDDGVLYVQGYNVKVNSFKFHGIKRVSREFHERNRKSHLETGDLLTIQTGVMTGVTAVVPDYLEGANCHALVITRLYLGMAEPQYYSYFFNSYIGREKLKTIETGSTMQHLNIAPMKTLLLPCPPLAEQQLIAAALSDVDAEIVALDDLIAKKQAIKQGAMQDLLTGQQRLPGFDTGVGYKQTEIGVIPADWDTAKIGTLVSDFRGGAPLRPSDFTEIGIKVLPKGGVTRGGRLKIGEDSQQYCSKKYAERHQNNMVDNNYTIVVLRDLVPSGPSIGLIVRIETDEEFVLAQGVYGFIVDDTKVSADFLIQLSNTHEWRKVMNTIMVGSTQVHITNTAFKKVVIPLPLLEEQQKIADIFNSIDDEIIALQEQRDKTHTLKQGMMQELLTGQIRLV